MVVRLKSRTRDARRLSVGVEYVVVQIDDIYYRLVNDGGEPVLYNRDRFMVIDDRIPDDWVRDEYADGEYFIGPPETATRGFWERWHDGDPEARRVFTDLWHRISSSRSDHANAVSATPPVRLRKSE